jgi:hypothetical protein
MRDKSPTLRVARVSKRDVMNERQTEGVKVDPPPCCKCISHQHPKIFKKTSFQRATFADTIIWVMDLLGVLDVSRRHLPSITTTCTNLLVELFEGQHTGQHTICMRFRLVCSAFSHI